MEKVEIQVRKFKDKLTDHSGEKSVKHIESAE